MDYEITRASKPPDTIMGAGSWRANPKKLEAWVDTNSICADDVAGANVDAE